MDYRLINRIDRLQRMKQQAQPQEVEYVVIVNRTVVDPDSTEGETFTEEHRFMGKTA